MFKINEKIIDHETSLIVIDNFNFINEKFKFGIKPKSKNRIKNKEKVLKIINSKRICSIEIKRENFKYNFSTKEINYPTFHSASSALTLGIFQLSYHRNLTYFKLEEYPEWLKALQKEESLTQIKNYIAFFLFMLIPIITLAMFYLLIYIILLPINWF